MEAGRELTDAGRRDRDGGIAVGELELRGRYLRAVGRRQGTGQALRTGRLLVVTRKSRRAGDPVQIDGVVPGTVDACCGDEHALSSAAPAPRNNADRTDVLTAA